MYHNGKLDGKGNSNFVLQPVPPSIPRIVDDRGEQVSSLKSVWPFKEGDPLTIQYVATGGKNGTKNTTANLLKHPENHHPVSCGIAKLKLSTKHILLPFKGRSTYHPYKENKVFHIYF